MALELLEEEEEDVGEYLVIFLELVGEEEVDPAVAEEKVEEEEEEVQSIPVLGLAVMEV